MELTIGHLYPDLLNLYGDRGNIRCMVKRLNWRGIDAHVKEFQLHDPIDFNSLDIVLLGGGSDREQKLVCEELSQIRDDFLHYVEDDGVVLAICSAPITRWEKKKSQVYLSLIYIRSRKKDV